VHRVKSTSSVTIYRFTITPALQCPSAKYSHSQPHFDNFGNFLVRLYTDKKENEFFTIFKDIQMGSGAKSYMRKGFLIYEEMRKYFTIYEKAVRHI